VRFIDVYNQLL